jgi:ribosomal protein S18 acetylase RimI-like enzyme
VRPASPDDLPWVRGFLDETGSARVARRGELVYPLDHPMLLALDDGVPSGLLTYMVDGEACEVVTIHAVRPGHGIGTALLAAVGEAARVAGCAVLWLVTTNDNVDALRFYQLRGFRIRAIRAGAVADSRARLKPEIPAIGMYGIPLRDEIELEAAVSEP